MERVSMKRVSQGQISSFFKRAKSDSAPGSEQRKQQEEPKASQGDLTSFPELELELTSMGKTWLEALEPELKKPYFLQLKRFLADQFASKTVFPPKEQIYSWSRLTKVNKVRVVILGQDPYHNYNQAHGLAFSVQPPTPAPPSLQNIFKELEQCYPGFQRPPNKTGLLTSWSVQGVLLLNACLTVEAHKANSHANRGWEQFTEQVLRTVLKENPDGVCFMVWGTPAAKRLEKVSPGPQHLVLKSVHPSPLSASRGWFGSAHFVKANSWLRDRYDMEIDWNLGKTTSSSLTQKDAKPLSDLVEPGKSPQDAPAKSGPVSVTST